MKVFFLKFKQVVLAPCVYALIEFYNRTHNSHHPFCSTPHERKTSICIDDFKRYYYTKVWGGTEQEASQIVHEFFSSPEFVQLQPIPGAHAALQKLKHKYELYIVTARHSDLEHVTRQFVQNHFPNLFTDIVFGNLYATKGEKRNKSEMMKQIQAQVLIDDSLVHAKEIVEQGMTSILFGEYPWNEEYQNGQHARIIKAVNWDSGM